MRIVSQSLVIFALSGLAGPLLRWATWPPSPTSKGPLGNLVYDLVLLLWPTQPLAVLEASMGSPAAIALSVTANVVLFGVIGILAGALARNVIGLSSVYVAVCVLVLVVVFWSVGVTLSYLNLIALVVALVLYAVPFILVSQLPRTRKPQ